MDPRLLAKFTDEDISTRRNDPYRNVEIKKPSSIIEKLMGLFYDPINPIGIGPTELGTIGGVVLNKTNLPKFAQQFEDLVSKIPKQSLTRELEEAKIFLKLKYPKLYDLPYSIENHYTPGVAASYSPVKWKGAGSITTNSSLPGGANDKIKDLAHELIHAYQNKRYGPEYFDDYVSPESNILDYLKQPAEVNARKGANTALNAYYKVRDYVLSSLWK